MSGVGFGKAILFGEHFVVYGLPGIAAAIELNTTCFFEKNSDRKEGIFANDLVTGELIKYGEHPEKRLAEVLSIIFSELNFKEKNFHLKLVTNMSVKGGMGSSAALAVSICKCLDKEFSLNLDNAFVNDVAYKVEKLFHSNPSGIDNTVSTYGGLIRFRKKNGGNEIEKIMLKKPVEMVLVDTGLIRDTGEAVDFVKKQKEENPKKFEGIFSGYVGIEKEALVAVKKEQWEKVGKLMNKNQLLLKEMNVSSKELDEIIDTALDAGAFGAKLTGAGLGGNAIILSPGKELQEKVAKACTKKGHNSYKILVGMPGD